jgi:hypothetical protein
MLQVELQRKITTTGEVEVIEFHEIIVTQTVCSQYEYAEIMMIRGR